MNDTFCKKLLELRTKSNITQNELAQKIGVTRQAISKWERGDGLPDLYNTNLLAKALNVTVDELLNDEVVLDNIDFSNKKETYYSGLLKGNYLKNILYKAKHTTNSLEAKKIKKILLIAGGIGLIIGISLILSGFFGFAKGSMDAVENFGPDNLNPFSPIPFMIVFLAGGVITALSTYVFMGGFSIVIAGVTTKYLDTRTKCPNCGNEIDPDEKICSNCGYDLKDVINKVCSCGKINQPEDIYCRECGKKLN
ncbi:MAG: helix-turn-helix domain-containing protein [Candidatus Izemoplasmatales bacterium]